MQTLILVRHSESKLDPNLPPHRWGLTTVGRQRCMPLAAQLKRFHPGVVVTSHEPKARETGKIIAEVLGLDWQTAPGLQEQLREAGKILSHEAFHQDVADLFAFPNELVFGLETANQALRRFSDAVQAVMLDHPGCNPAIVTHGTVMALYYQSMTGMDAYSFWRRMELPAFYMVSWPDSVLQSVVYEV